MFQVDEGAHKDTIVVKSVVVKSVLQERSKPWSVGWFLLVSYYLIILTALGCGGLWC